jgi:hypothetical protein
MEKVQSSFHPASTNERRPMTFVLRDIKTGAHIYHHETADSVDRQLTPFCRDRISTRFNWSSTAMRRSTFASPDRAAAAGASLTSRFPLCRESRPRRCTELLAGPR